MQGKAGVENNVLIAFQTLDLSCLLDTPRVTYAGYVVGSIVA